MKREDKIKFRLCFSHKIFGNEKMKSAVRVFGIRLKWGWNKVQLWACRGNDLSTQLQPPLIPPPISFPVSSLTRDVSSSQRPLRHSVDTCYFQEEEKLWVCSSVWFLPLFIFTLSSPVGYVLLVDLLQIYHTLSSTQQTQLISSRSITESSLEDTSRNPPFVAAELLGDAWGKYVGMLDKSDCTICV